ncbi:MULTISPECIES: MIP/aquaporin family protein [unclassified Nocardioides]|uniref:MIP/aquaporin family protein n=1 Tax=unclassified Nocardioides TaxID=2615069 RepID=UPI001F608475|nr:MULTISPECIES: MIP family channel protein [unclassified Nocardioides]
MADSTIQQKLTAEMIGTFVLVFFGCGSVVYATQAQAASTVTTIGLTFGIAVMVMVYAFGRVSGAHFNPAVSAGAAVGGRMPWAQAGLYMIAQLVGAILGALVLFLLMHGYDGFEAEGGMGQNFFGDQSPGSAEYAWWAAFLLELLMTAVFVTVILAVTDERNEHPSLAPLAIGFTLAAIHFVVIPATGTSVNPARSIGPALFAGSDAIIQLWLFILAPLLGGAVAGLAYPLLFGRVGDPVPGSGISFSRPRTAAQVPGYAAPDQYQQQWNQDTSAGYAAQAAAPAAPAPIIQDGWQWDPVGQQWHPVGQTPEQWRAQQAAEQEAAAAAAAQPVPTESVPEQQTWPGPEAGDETQIRPPGQ